jgi:UDP-glucuronate 4-epimerase
MAPMRFAQRMLKGEPIPVYNNGNMIRDFTYIDDINDGVIRIAEANILPRYQIYNIGRGEPVELMDFIQALERHLGVSADINLLPMQDGDVPRTMADTSAIRADFQYRPSISIDEGVKRFADWYQDYHHA